MSETQQPQRPPTSGRGSSVEAWREYAAALTDSPVEAWQELSREEIIELLDAEGAEQPESRPEPEHPVGESDETRPRRRRRRRRAPQWMVPTDNGPVPERELQQAKRDEFRAKAAQARAAREAKAPVSGVSTTDVAALNTTTSGGD